MVTTCPLFTMVMTIPMSPWQHCTLTPPCLSHRKRLFFRDMNLDQSDPVQVNLLYAQMKEDINDGTHPVSKEEAIHLAALQFQVTYGSFNEAMQKPGLLP